jgi:hypothetical protein
MKAENSTSIVQEWKSWLKREVSIPPHGSEELKLMLKQGPTLEHLLNHGTPLTPMNYYSRAFDNPMHVPDGEEQSNLPELFQTPDKFLHLREDWVVEEEE